MGDADYYRGNGLHQLLVYIESQEMNTATRSVVAVGLAALLAQPAEGLYHIAYYDPPHVLTACWGHTGKDVKEGVYYSMEQCQAWFDEDMKRAIATVERCQPGLPPHVLAAFGDGVFNMGSTIACNLKTSTAARYLKTARESGLNDFTAACNQLPRWNKARIMGIMVSLPGLTKRREAERQVCLGNPLP